MKKTYNPFAINGLTPRVLNIHNGDRESNNLPAISIDISAKNHLNNDMLKAEFFTAIRISSVLQDIPSKNIVSFLSRFKKYLNKHGAFYVSVPKDKMSFEQLSTYLSQAGFTHIELLPSNEDLAYQCGVNDQSQKEESILVFASMKKIPHAHDESLGEKEFQKKCDSFRKKYTKNPPTSFIIPVYNEEKNLRQFLTFVENSKNNTNTKREYIFVINGCTDKSEEVLVRYLDQSLLDWKLLKSDKGITPAYKKGIEERNLDGFIGKLDADVVLHPHLLDLMQMDMVENENLQVTYAEPTPLDAVNIYNANDHRAELMSKRLYFTSKASICREDPFVKHDLEEILKGVMAEDIFLSFYYAYYYGLDSIGRTPHGLVYCKTVGNFEDLVKQQSRAESDIKRLFEAHPSFAILGRIMEQEVYPGTDYYSLMVKARANKKYVEEWTRIMSTK